MTIAEKYIIQREQIINDDLSQPYINKLKAKYDQADPAMQLAMLGIKNRTNAKILTIEEDKASRESRFAEDNIVNALAKWFKGKYPGIPYTIDKVANKRNKLSGAIMSAASYQKGNPDIFIQCAKGPYHGLYIEQKKDDSIFYEGTRILKPGDLRVIWQSLYHADLREQGYWVMFSISLEASKKITERYMSGNPYKMQVFDYYCKPEDRDMFEFHKHFKPLKDKP